MNQRKHKSRIINVWLGLQFYGFSQSEFLLSFSAMRFMHATYRETQKISAWRSIFNFLHFCAIMFGPKFDYDTEQISHKFYSYP